MQVIDLKDKKRCLTRPTAGLTWSEIPSLSADKMEEVKVASERLLARRQYQTPPKSVKPNSAPRSRRERKRGEAFFWLLENISSTIAYMWGHRRVGTLGSASFLGWRAWRMLRVGEWIRWGRRRIEDFHEVYDAAEEATAHVRTLYETGELELMMVALGGGIVVSYIMYVFCCAKRPKSDVKIAIDSGSSGSDSEGFKASRGRAFLITTTSRMRRP